MDLVIDAWVSVFGALIRTFKLIEVQVEFPAEALNRNRWRLILSNHQSWVDIILLQTTFRHKTAVLKFFTKRELIWLPFIGLAMWFLGFPYVYRAGSKPAEVVEAQREINEAVLAREGTRFLEKPVAVISFAEGSRFTERKRIDRNSPYKHLLAPRRGGVIQVLNTLTGHINEVLDVTIHYEGAIPGFWDLLTGRAPAASLTVQEIPLPGSDEAAISTWLNDLWSQKDEHLLALQDNRS